MSVMIAKLTRLIFTQKMYKMYSNAFYTKMIKR